jgi:hypothetical protein
VDAKVHTCMNERNSTHQERCADVGKVAGAANVIELNIRRFEESASLGSGEPLTAGVAARHSCLTALVCHVLAALAFGCRECDGRQQTRHCRHPAQHERQCNHAGFDHELHHTKSIALADQPQSKAKDL